MRKKILIVSDFFGNKTTTFIYNDVIELSKTNDVHYLCNQRNNHSDFPFQNVHEIPFSDSKLIRKLRWWSEIYDIYLSFHNYNYAKKINRLVEELNPDVIHCHFGYEALRFYQNFNKTKFNKIPIVVTFHGHDASFLLERRSYVSAIGKMLSDERVCTTIVCKFLEGKITSKNIRPSKSSIIHCGINVDLFKRKSFARPKSEIKFLQISHMEARKGQRETILAFNKFILNYPQINASLTLAGGGPELFDNISLANSLGIAHLVNFPGWISPQEAIEYLESADVFLHHSLTVNNTTEGIPVAIMEAMAMELPIISTNHAGIPELVKNGINGYLVSEGDIESYAEAMHKSSKLGFLPVNRKVILEEFSLNSHINSLNNIYSISSS